MLGPVAISIGLGMTNSKKTTGNNPKENTD